ncbi:Xanthine and CO dehydrogenases maturation factor, XdhC/CoxF family [Grimontia indica]|uniref:Xanthine and CO dehydrogenases maturation factor, XdhC/CoxF family n=1 Tax=Grimontia indica TaxID=1056512 RepID=R1J160_9GAMM|nr:MULTISPECIES: XdhC/CoxI family protein [Grimontia]EOD81350.1 Xanthine and CO dehydrogenases maturation factor, XdhC/CoxF family [Grimontia indica]
MANHLHYLLNEWYPERDNAEWVLGTVYETEGPCYRKAGAMMLFSSLGQQLGMLSGGCLESDIQRHAKKVMMTGEACTLTYDSQDEDDLSFQLGIGCGGTVHIMLQPIHKSNGYLSLDVIRAQLEQRRSGFYYQRIVKNSAEIEANYIPSEKTHQLEADKNTIGERLDEGHQRWLKTFIQPPTHLLVCGGGFDARPIVSLAHQLGWRVTLWDPRPANARRDYFQTAHHILREQAETLGYFCNEKHVDAAVVMTHSVSLDASVLKSLTDTRLRYLALLGPAHRKEDVLQTAELQESQLPCKLAGPAGLQLGAALPEGIGLSILSECMAALNDSNAKSFSGIV